MEPSGTTRKTECGRTSTREERAKGWILLSVSCGLLCRMLLRLQVGSYCVAACCSWWLFMLSTYGRDGSPLITGNTTTMTTTTRATAVARIDTAYGYGVHAWCDGSEQASMAFGESQSLHRSLSLSSLSPLPLPRPSSINNTRRGEEGRERASERARVLCVRCCIPPRPSTAVTLDILTILDRQGRNGIVTSICLF